MKFKNFILDVDGVFTDGKFHYTELGKTLKTFGDCDSDALSLLRKYLHIEMISGDKRGFAITKKRIGEDMGFPVSLVSTFERKEWLNERFNLSETIYMGDGLFDVLVFDVVGFSIAPQNAVQNTKSQANYVTKNRGAEGAVTEAVCYIFENIIRLDINQVIRSRIQSAGVWENSRASLL